MALIDPTILDNSEPMHVAWVWTRQWEYNERSEVRERMAAYMKEWKRQNRERLLQYRREYNQRPQAREKRLRYQRGYRQRPEVIAEARRRKAFSGLGDGYGTVSLDHPIENEGRGVGLNRHQAVGSVAGDPLVQLTGRQQEAMEMLGDLSDEDIGRMSEHDLSRLRERLIEAGLTPATQYEERARARRSENRR